MRQDCRLLIWLLFALFDVPDSFLEVLMVSQCFISYLDIRVVQITLNVSQYLEKSVSRLPPHRKHIYFLFLPFWTFLTYLTPPLKSSLYLIYSIRLLDLLNIK